MKQYLFKVKEGKLQQWKDWTDFLIEHKQDVIETMRHEHANREIFTHFEVGGDDYIVSSAEFFDDPVPADMSVELNQLHKKNIRECLTKLANGETLYDFKI